MRQGSQTPSTGCAVISQAGCAVISQAGCAVISQAGCAVALLCLMTVAAWGQDPATSAWATGGGSATAKPSDPDGKPGATKPAAAAPAAVPYWQAQAAPGHVIQMNTSMPPGWQPQAVPYQGIGPDGRPMTVYIAPTYVFTYQSGPPVIAAPQVNRTMAPRITRPGVAPTGPPTGWNYQAVGAPPPPPPLAVPTIARYAPQPYQFPADSRALTGTPLVPPATPLNAPPPPPQVWATPPPSQWVSVPPGAPPQWVSSDVAPPPGVAPFAAATAVPAVAAASSPPPPPPAPVAGPPVAATTVSMSPTPAPIPVAAPQTIPLAPVAGGLPPNATPQNTHLWKVVAVYDGDTVTCLDENNQQQKIRLAEIDAPEAKQDFGKTSREQLASMVFGRNVYVVDSGRDRYGRWIGRLYVDGIDVNRQMVATGMAWHYAQYSKDTSLATIQGQAQAQRVGLWSQPNPVPPWEFRASGGKPT
jgi:endonuclease YncB( thermonuclease family)